MPEQNKKRLKPPGDGACGLVATDVSFFWGIRIKYETLVIVCHIGKVVILSHDFWFY